MKKITLLLFVIFSGQLFAADMIYAWGYGDILGQALTAVKFTFAHNDYAGIFKFALLIAVTMATISSAQLGMKGDMLSLPKLFAMSIGVSTLFITWKIDVVVKDVSTNQQYVVDGVPWAVAKPMVWFSGMEKHIGDIMETTFSVPSDISYSNGGFLSPFSTMDSAANARITDPNLFQSVDNFIIDCVAPDIASGYYDVTMLAHSEDLWAEFSDTNPARVTYYYKTGSTPQIETCADAYTKINSDLMTYTTGTGMASLGSMLGGYSGAQISSILGTSSNYFMNYSKSASSFLMQSIMLNQFNDTYKNWATTNGMAGDTVAYGVGKGEQTAQANMVISGVLGSKYIPVIKGILTVIIAGLTPIVALLLLTPLFWKILSGYLLTMVWLSLWHVGEVLLNFIVLVKASNYMQSVVNSNGVYNMVSKPVVDGSFINYVNMASSMYWMIPTIAAVIVGGFSYMAFQGMTGGMTARVARGEGASMEAAAGVATLGNVTMGNTRSNQQMSANNMSAGQNYNLSNTASLENGSNVVNTNTNNSNSYRLGGMRMTSGSSYTSSGNIDTFSSGLSMTSEDGKTTIAGGSGSQLKNGEKYQGDFTTMRDGVMMKEHYEQGILKSSDTTLKGGFTSHYEDRDGSKQTTIANKELGASITYDTENGRVLGQTGNAIAITKGFTKALEESTGESTKASLTSTIEKMKSGQKVDSDGIQYVASTLWAAANQNSHVSSHAREQAVSDIRTTLESTAENHSKGNQEAWKETKAAQKTNATQLESGITLTAGVSTDDAAIGKLASAALGAKAGMNASAGIKNAHIDQNSVTFDYGNGVSKSYEISQSFKNDHAKAMANIVKDSVVDSSTSSTTNTNSLGATGSSGSTSSSTLGMSYKGSEGYGEELVRNFVEKTAQSVSVSDQKALQNKILSEYLNEKSGDYLGGRAALIQDYLSAKDSTMADFEKYARNYTGLQNQPTGVLSSDSREKLVEGAGTVGLVKNQTAGAESAFINSPTGASLGAARNALGGGGGVPTVDASNPTDSAWMDAQNNSFASTKQEGDFKYQHFDLSGSVKHLSESIGGTDKLKGAGNSPAQKIDDLLDDAMKKLK